MLCNGDVIMMTKEGRGGINIEWLVGQHWKGNQKYLWSVEIGAGRTMTTSLVDLCGEGICSVGGRKEEMVMTT
jgi:hypothetical protein